jgi:sigma-B regulation protein RsbU (phosphoserine phosphatase)
MMLRTSMRRTLLVVCLFLCAAAHAQVFDLDYDRQPILTLNGQWFFHPGDDPRWADKNFDDSKWTLLHSNRDWSQQGYKNMSGMAWYRFKVVVPENSPPVSLYVPELLTSYQVYADGALIGGFGGMPPDAEADHNLAQTIPLPPSTKAAHTVTFAIRVWHAPLWASYFGGGPHAAPLIGAAPLIEQYARREVLTQSWGLVDEVVLSILEGLAGLAALAFFFLRPGEREYLWFGVMLLSSATLRCFSNWAQSHRIGVLLRDDLSGLLVGITTLAAIAFYVTLLRGRRNWFFWLTLVSTVLSVVSEFADGHLISVQRSQALAAFFLIPFSVWVLTLLYRATRAGLADARLLLFPVLMQQIAALIGIGLWLSYTAGWQRTYAQQDVALSNWPFYFTLSDVAAALFLVAMLTILIYRFTRMSQEEERLEGELGAARSVQHILIPEETPFLPGFKIASVYKPASEVGGDFYQVIPLEELGCAAGDQVGGALVIVGDVSGKGLQAAMTVSLIVGTLRTLADHTQEPARILAGLNRRLIGRSNGGFTTCLVMLLDAVGGLTIATAGHLAPYLNGKELALDDGLPLGITLDATYEETHFKLAQGDKMTMISDGVLEARNAAGELFGFDRTRALSTQDASYIAHAAQEFGQEDDITVLTLTRLVEAKI